MSHAWGLASRKRLATCHGDLVLVFDRVLPAIDCSILCGHRGRAEQEAAFAAGKSKARWGASPHNRLPSLAVDAAPFPIVWTDRERFVLFAGFVLGTARELGVDLTWGGDWNRDWRTADNRFDDFVHFELTGWRNMTFPPAP